MRSFRCRDCGETRDVETTTGPLPSVCDVCDPEAPARRLAAREAAVRRGSEVARLRARVAELEEQTVDLEMRLRRGEPADRRSVTRAVRLLGMARGRQETIRRLMELSAECRAWADALRHKDPQDLPKAA
jgi:hypothetical protein